MNHVTSKLYSILSLPIVYHIFQKIMKGDQMRKKIITAELKEKNLNVLDIGCGLGTSLDYLNKPNYFGYDISDKYISYAKKKYKNIGTFYCKKFTERELKNLEKFDYVILMGILHHLSEIEIKNLMELIKKALKKDGKIVTLDPVFTKNQNIIAKFLISNDRGKNIKTKKNYLKLLGKYFKKTKSKIYHQNFIPYTWFTTICSN